jgi:Membrane bound beta barrel domain (DUF5777)
MKKLVLFIGILSIGLIAKAQEEDLSKLVDANIAPATKEKIAYTFKTSRLINLATNEQVKKGELDFKIAHRFANMLGTGARETNLFGLDGVSDIRFSFDYGVSDRWMIGVGRSKGAYAQSQVYDLNSKFKILEQQTKGMPLGLSANVQATYTTMASSGISSTVTNFDKSMAHRLQYFAQLIAVKKISPSISLVLAPSIIHRNLVSIGDNNTQFALGLGARIKMSKRAAIIVDYYQLLNKSSYQTSINYMPPIGLGFEVETGGHVFHVLLSNTRGLTESQFLTENYSTPGNEIGQMRLGFNISRVFTVIHDKAK